MAVIETGKIPLTAGVPKSVVRRAASLLSALEKQSGPLAVGGVLGALLLLVTPASFFARLVPWLVLFATGVFAWGSFFQKKQENAAPKLGTVSKPASSSRAAHMTSTSRSKVESLNKAVTSASAEPE